MGTQCCLKSAADHWIKSERDVGSYNIVSGPNRWFKPTLEWHHWIKGDTKTDVLNNPPTETDKPSANQMTCGWESSHDASQQAREAKEPVYQTTSRQESATMNQQSSTWSSDLNNSKRFLKTRLEELLESSVEELTATVQKVNDVFNHSRGSRLLQQFKAGADVYISMWNIPESSVTEDWCLSAAAICYWVWSCQRTFMLLH